MGEILTISNYHPNDSSTSIDFETHSHNFITDMPSGQIVCNLCGLVKETNIIVSSWDGVPYSNETTISISKKSLMNINPNLKRALKLNRNKSWDDRKLTIGINEIKRLCARFGLGEYIVTRSIYLFQKAIQCPNFKIHNVILTSQVCFFYSAKLNKHPLSIEEVIEDHNFSSRLAYRYYYLLMSQLQLVKPESNPAPLIPKLCASLGLDEFVVQQANLILSIYLKHENTSGLNSVGIVAGVIYFACLRERIPRSQQIIAQYAKISDITLRTRYKEIKKICGRHM
ncbi:hypothetical protein [Candidatus Lokiarchaeum ossiferum]|uniref:hypothetical protein n=1 Tax=Candidatus Lokiarchaeum ossiferum TaxID=2951803 RepID=UPI00352CD09D